MIKKASSKAFHTVYKSCLNSTTHSIEQFLKEVRTLPVPPPLPAAVDCADVTYNVLVFTFLFIMIRCVLSWKFSPNT